MNEQHLPMSREPVPSVRFPLAGERSLEYLMVQELLHLLERHHNARFKAMLDRHLPPLRAVRDELNQALLGHERWQY